MRSTRWLICVLITVAIAIGYLDRQTLALTTKAIEHDIAISDDAFGNLQSIFFFAYALMYVGGGRLMDALGTRRGFLLIALCWSLACAAHGLATGVWMLAAGRLMLGLALGGSFPGAAKAMAEWFPTRERGTAMGVINGGSSVGAVVAPWVVAAILAYAHWPWVFFFSGAMGLLWTVWWLLEYYPPNRHPRLSAEERSRFRKCSSPRPSRNPKFPGSACWDGNRCGEWWWASASATPFGSVMSPGCPSTSPICAASTPHGKRRSLGFLLPRRA